MSVADPKTPTAAKDNRPPSNSDSASVRAAVWGAVSVVGIAFLIPLAQMMSGIPPEYANQFATATLPPPPPVMDDLLPPPPPPEDQDQPELKEAPPPPSIDVLDMMLNPDVSGMASGDMTMPVFDVTGEMTNLDIFDVTELDERPSATFQQQPIYPESMKRAGIGGRVILRFEVDKEGRTRNIIVEQSPNPAFDKPAVDAVRAWRFTVGKKNGRAVEFRMRLPLVFTPPDRF